MIRGLPSSGTEYTLVKQHKNTIPHRFLGKINVHLLTVLLLCCLVAFVCDTLYAAWEGVQLYSLFLFESKMSMLKCASHNNKSKNRCLASWDACSNLKSEYESSAEEDIFLHFQLHLNRPEQHLRYWRWSPVRQSISVLPSNQTSFAWGVKIKHFRKAWPFTVFAGL